jgi:translation initiation factor IF-3
MHRGKLRINAEITAPEVAVIAPDGNTRKVMATAEALRLAQGQGLDLVEVDPVAHPPLCKIFDLQKFKYATAKAQARARYKDVELEIRDNQIKEKE